MSGYAAVAVYSLKVPSGDEPTPALGLEEYPATFRITMAAIDPTEKPEADEDGKVEALPRATLKMIRLPSLPDDSDDEDDEEDEDYDMAHLLDDVASEDDEDEDEEEGAESRKATAEKLKKALATAGDDMEVDAAADEDDEEEDDEDDEDEDDLDDEDLLEGAQEVVLCTLDPTKMYQQTLDITINENEQVFFQVSGSHSVHLSGNILVPLDEDEDSEDEYDSDDEYDLEPGEDELGMLDDDEEDELDALDDPRVVDVSDDVAAPALVPADAVAQKGKNKRAAEDSPVADKTTNGDVKLTKAQKKAQKKLKNNAGAAVDADAEEAATPAEAVKASPAAKADKKVQFAKTLVQGPTSSTSPKVTAEAPKADAGKPKASLGVKVVQGVTIDDKKLGTGPAAKKGDKVSMRYIGKLDKDKRVFDSNKKGAPFTFKLGAGQVIKGWDIGVAGMSVGGERRITIPANLAYGSKSQKDIPANSTLVFDLKLLEIK